MTKMSKTSLAKRRSGMLEKAGVRTEASERYRRDVDVINKSGMSALQKKKAIEKISGKFVRSKESTVGGIKEKFGNLVKGGLISKKGVAAVGNDLQKMADYIGASKSSRRYFEAKELAMSSDQIKYAVDRLKDTGLSGKKQTSHLMRIMSEATDRVINGQRPPSSDIYALIDEYMEKRGLGE